MRDGLLSCRTFLPDIKQQWKKFYFRKDSVWWWMINKTYCGDHFVIHTNIKLLCYHLTIMLHVNYTSINHFSIMCTCKYNRYYWYTSRVEVSFIMEILICSKVCEMKCIVSIKTLFVSQLVQSLSRVWLFATLWTAVHQASQSITNSQRLSKFTSIALVMPFNYLIICCPILLPPLIFPGVRVFSNKLVLCIRWPKY